MENGPHIPYPPDRYTEERKAWMFTEMMRRRTARMERRAQAALQAESKAQTAHYKATYEEAARHAQAMKTPVRKDHKYIPQGGGLEPPSKINEETGYYQGVPRHDLNRYMERHTPLKGYAKGGVLTVDTWEALAYALEAQIEDVKYFGNEYFRNYARALIGTLSEYTPFKTGWARNNWQIGVNAIPMDWVPNEDHLGEEIEKLKWVDILKEDAVYIVNNLWYVQFLEAGRSPIAPNGITQPALSAVHKKFNADTAKVYYESGLPPTIDMHSMGYGFSMEHLMEEDLRKLKATRARHGLASSPAARGLGNVPVEGTRSRSRATAINYGLNPKNVAKVNKHVRGKAQRLTHSQYQQWLHDLALERHANGL